MVRLPWPRRRRHDHHCWATTAHRAAQDQADAYRADLGRTSLDLAASEDARAKQAIDYQAALDTIADLRRQLDKANSADRDHNATIEELGKARAEAARLREQLAEVTGFGTLPSAIRRLVPRGAPQDRVEAERRITDLTQQLGVAIRRGDRLEELLARAEGRPVQVLPDERGEGTP